MKIRGLPGVFPVFIPSEGKKIDVFGKMKSRVNYQKRASFIINSRVRVYFILVIVSLYQCFIESLYYCIRLLTSYVYE